MDFWTIAICWFVISFITCIIFLIKAEKEITVRTLCWSILLGAVGGIALIAGFLFCISDKIKPFFVKLFNYRIWKA